jgi:excinuclease ABC subunit A
LLWFESWSKLSIGKNQVKMEDYIFIKGARLHNLKNIDVRIPRNHLVVITGPSGSGKSSLAFDTLYAEGQRRYVESLSAYARQFLERMPKPDIDYISGVSPAIAIEQKNPTSNARSTVGTVTEIYDYLRLLFARIGHTYCPNCKKEIKKETPSDAYKFLKKLSHGTGIYICFPLRQGQIRNLEAERKHLIAQGFMRIWQGGKVFDLNGIFAEDLIKPDTYVAVDRLKISRQLDRGRIMDSLETAFRSGEGYAAVITTEGEIHSFNQNFECSNCGIPMIPPQPRLFSFNNPFGACPGCQGFRDMMGLDMDKIVPDKKKSLRQGAIYPWTMPHYRWFNEELLYIAPQQHIPLDVPFSQLKEDHLDIIMNGVDEFPGINGFFRYLESKKYKVHVRVLMSRFRTYFTCTQCNGARLRPEALQVKINGKHISQMAQLKIDELADSFKELKLAKHEKEIADQLLSEIHSRLKYLLDVGLDYLTLDRRANTLSGGEFQRINLATALGSSLTGSLYVLDEPTVGLHSRDTHRLIHILESLRDTGNTVVVVEHDLNVMQASNRIIDLGPAAGEHGGNIVFEGEYSQLTNGAPGLTAAYLRKEKSVPVKTKLRKGRGRFITVTGARKHNLKNITVKIPLGMLVCVTGVSGSGKSTLIHDVLYNGIRKRKGLSSGKEGDHDDIQGLQHIYGVEMVDQSPIGRTPRSNPVTFIKAFDEIRKLFAQTHDAHVRGFKPGHFSFNVSGGRCDVCEGDGQITVDMQFLADMYLICDACKGKRYKPEVLNVLYRGKNIHDVLEMTVDEALEFFAESPKTFRALKVLQDVGLGYLHLGQPATTLSGGEAQRIKLAANLTRKDHQDNLYIFDEPTTGLHFDDIAKLLHAFDHLLDKGASIIIIEHNLDVIKYADHIIDLGPEGGDRGGEVIATGTPSQIVENAKSYTGKFLREM